MFVLGLTGPSGAGKGEAARTLREEGFFYIDADTAARAVVEPGRPCLRDLAEAFGKEILREDGSLDRKKLAKIAFFDTINTEKLNSITHPYIIGNIEEDIKRQREKGVRYIVLDAPTLFESGAWKLCDRVLCITADGAVRLDRIKKRDGLTDEEALLRLRAQPDPEFYKGRSDDVIENDGSPAELAERVLRLAEEIKNDFKNA